MDMIRLKKIMGKTDSLWDGEALAAIRLANKMLKEENTTWEQVLSRNNGHKDTSPLDDLFRWARTGSGERPRPDTQRPRPDTQRPRPDTQRQRRPNDENTKKKKFKIRTNR